LFSPFPNDYKLMKPVRSLVYLLPKIQRENSKRVYVVPIVPGTSNPACTWGAGN
jgi:hypothetical protein